MFDGVPGPRAVMYATLLAAALGLGPMVEVDATELHLPESEAAQLHGQTLARLVEAGYATGSSGTVVVRLSGDGVALRVEVRDGQRVLYREVTSRGAVARLEAIHIALEMLDEVSESTARAKDSAPPPAPDDGESSAAPDPPARSAHPSLHVVAGGVSPPELGPTLKALADRGFTLVPKRDQAWVTVCVAGAALDPQLAVAEPEQSCPAPEHFSPLSVALDTTVPEAVRLATPRSPTAGLDREPVPEPEPNPDPDPDP
ncbi:MAG: hypothetical protein AAF721_25890, partial [Myxococcota bacterium]